jgi:DNA-directed RNA polymerase specialized sigma24 family protein
VDADDVVQDTLLVLVTASKTIKHADRYAFTVAHHLVCRAAREGRWFPPPATPADKAHDEAGHLADLLRTAREQEWNTQVEGEVVRREIAAAYAAGKRMLTPLQRGVVERTVEDQQPRAEAAKELGVGEGTVSPHRARALLKLQAHLIGFVGMLAGVIALVTAALVVTAPANQAMAIPGFEKAFNMFTHSRRKRIRRAWVQAMGRDLAEENLSARIFWHLFIRFIPTVAAGAFWVTSRVCDTIAVGLEQLGLIGTPEWRTMQVLHISSADLCDRLCDRICDRLDAAFPHADQPDRPHAR